MAAVRNPNQSPPAPAPMLVPVGQHKGQQPLPLKRSFTLIGSTASARLYLPSKAISRCHAVIINTGAGLFVRDLASRTQTRINGQVVNEADLREGDVLQVGSFTFRFTDPTAPNVRPPVLPPPTAVFEVDGLDEPLPVEGRAVLIGRRETADISLTENAASAAHALVFVIEGKHLVRDLTSRTGTFVNGAKVHEQPLESGDVLRVGETSFRYVSMGGSGLAPKTTEATAPGKRGNEAVVPAAPAPAMPNGGPPQPAAPTPSEDRGFGDANDLDFIPIEVAPLSEPDAGPGPTAPSEDPSLVDAGNVPDEAIPVQGEVPGLLEMGETSRVAVAEVENSDVAVSPGGGLGVAAGDGDETELPELAPLAPPAEAAPAEKPARPAKGRGGWGRSTPGAGTPPKARNPFDVISEADDLEPLSDVAPEPPRRARPKADAAPDALLDLDPTKE